jgi:hypothetical protein
VKLPVLVTVGVLGNELTNTEIPVAVIVHPVTVEVAVYVLVEVGDIINGFVEPTTLVPSDHEKAVAVGAKLPVNINCGLFDVVAVAGVPAKIAAGV